MPSDPDLRILRTQRRFEPLVVDRDCFDILPGSKQPASIQRFLIGGIAIEPGLPTLVLLFSAAIKAAMFLRIRRIANLVSSPTLATASRDNLSDVLTSIAAFIGAASSKFIHPLADPIGGMLVALWIFRAVFNAVRENLGFLTGAGADKELREKLVTVASGVPGVLKVHHLMSEYTGPRLVVDLHINVDGSITLDDAHLISDQIIQRLEQLPEVDRAYVHIEPEGYN
jgi:cation diffusion facilitator family transporter